MAIRYVPRQGESAPPPERPRQQHAIQQKLIRQFQHKDATTHLDRAIALVRKGEADRAIAEVASAILLIQPDTAQQTGAMIDDCPDVLHQVLLGMKLVRLALKADDREAIGTGCKVILGGLDFLIACLALRAN